jgi:hypothetical protein
LDSLHREDRLSPAFLHDFSEFISSRGDETNHKGHEGTQRDEAAAKTPHHRDRRERRDTQEKQRQGLDFRGKKNRCKPQRLS